jgi:hypothetical protein
MKTGKRQIIQLLNRNIVANVTVMRFVQITCFVASVLVLAVSVWNLTRVELTAVQTVFGILLSSLTSLVFIGFGLLLPSLAVVEGEQSE